MGLCKPQVLLFTAVAASTVCLPASAERSLEAYPDYQARFYQRLGAECIHRAGPAVQCFKLLETSLEFDPKASIVHFTLGKYYVALGELDRASGAFSRALELDENLVVALLALGDVYLLKGQIEEGRRYYERFAEAAPDDPAGPYSLGASYAQALDEDRALAYLRTAIGLGFSDAATLREDPRWRNVVGSPVLEELLKPLPKGSGARE